MIDYSMYPSSVLLGRRHSIDSNIGRARTPTFVRTYREVKWKRVDTSGALTMTIPHASSDDNLSSRLTDSEVLDGGEYIEGTRIIRQRVPIFMTSTDPHPLLGRRFSAGDLVPVTDSTLPLSPDLKCLLIRDSPAHRNRHLSSSEDPDEGETYGEPEHVLTRTSSADESYLNKMKELNDFFLIDEDDDMDDDEEEADFLTIRESDSGINEHGVTEDLEEVASVLSTSDLSASGKSGMVPAQKPGTPRAYDLRRWALVNSIQKKATVEQSSSRQFTGASQLTSQHSSSPVSVSFQTHSDKTVMDSNSQSTITSQPTLNSKPLLTSKSTLQSNLTSSSNPEIKNSPNHTTKAVLNGSSQPIPVHTKGSSLASSSREPPYTNHSAPGVLSHPTDSHHLLKGNYSAVSPVPLQQIQFNQDAPKYREPKTASTLTSSGRSQTPQVFTRNSRSHPIQFKGLVPLEVFAANISSCKLIEVPASSSGEAPLVFQRVEYLSGPVLCSSRWLPPKELNTKSRTSQNISLISGGTTCTVSPRPNNVETTFLESVLEQHAPTPFYNSTCGSKNTQEHCLKNVNDLGGKNSVQEFLLYPSFLLDTRISSSHHTRDLCPNNSRLTTQASTSNDSSRTGALHKTTSDSHLYPLEGVAEGHTQVTNLCPESVHPATSMVSPSHPTCFLKPGDRTHGNDLCKHEHRDVTVTLSDTSMTDPRTTKDDRVNGIEAIDDKVEQAMDWAKDHMMSVVQEVVDSLQRQVRQLRDRMIRLEYDNTRLRQQAAPQHSSGTTVNTKQSYETAVNNTKIV